MNTHTIIKLIFIFFVSNVNCFIDPITGGAIAAGFGLFFGYNKIKCSFSECCNEENIPYDVGSKIYYYCIVLVLKRCKYHELIV